MEYLTVAFVAPNQSVALHNIVHLAAKTQCYIEESRCTILGSDFAGILRIAGNWNAIAKLEAALFDVHQQQEMTIEIKRTKLSKLQGHFLPYLVQVVALDTPDLAHEVTNFFAEQDIQIIDLQTDPFKTTHADTTMLTMSMRIHIPAEINIADLRERFMLICDDLNIDGIIEPEKR